MNKETFRFQLSGFSLSFQLPAFKKRLSFGFKAGTWKLAPGSSARGFTLLLAVLVSGILLALGLAIYNIVAKDLVLSSSGRESQFAFYASDTGIECALYWDGEPDAFALDSELPQISCGGASVPLVSDYDGINIVSTTFSISLGAGDTSPCADVLVEKHIAERQTIIESRGYNTCVTTNPRRIERAIRVQY